MPRHQVALEFTEAAFGVERTVEVDLMAACDDCEGTGAAPGTSPEQCEVCGGRGVVQHVAQTAFGQFVQSAPCAACGGRGQTIADPCRNLPRAWGAPSPGASGGADSRRYRRRPAAAAARPWACGRARRRAGRPVCERRPSRPTPRFQRDGNDIVSVLELPFSDAALGKTVTVETLDGPHELVIQPGAQPSDVAVLRGKGIPVLGGRGRGDHRVFFNVLVPRQLTDAQRDLLRQFEQTVDDTTYAGAEHGFFGRLRDAFR